MLKLFRNAAPAASVDFGGPTPYTTQLAPGSYAGPLKAAVVGRFPIPGSQNLSWQQPVTAPPTPQPGFKGIAPDTPIVPAPKRVVPLFSPAPSFDPDLSF